MPDSCGYERQRSEDALNWCATLPSQVLYRNSGKLRATWRRFQANHGQPGGYQLARWVGTEKPATFQEIQDQVFRCGR
jgi:hypothetical protein